jgi:hypothetical protein
MQRRFVLKVMGAAPLAAAIPIAVASLHKEPPKVGSDPFRFTVKRDSTGHFLDGEVAKVIADLKESKQIDETAPVRVQFFDREGKTWGSPKQVLLVHGTVSTFKPQETLKEAVERWPHRLQKLNIKAFLADKDLTTCFIEIPGKYGPDFKIA